MKNIAEVRSFLGLVEYYHRFIKGFSLIASPLIKLLKKKLLAFQWFEACQKSFNQLKNRLTIAPILTIPTDT